jgi:hypothetical protein
MAARLHVPQAKLMERSRRSPCVALAGLIGLAGGSPTFTTIHIDYSYRRISLA